MSDSYEQVIARKSASVAPSGFVVAESDLAPHLFPHQRDLTRWALRRGRAAVFAGTGLGKTAIELEAARHLSRLGRVLILAPLAVGPQIAAEGARWQVDARFARHDDGSAQILICNYQMLHALDPAKFVAVIADESSILKTFDGKTRNLMMEMFRSSPYKLCCTATPAPNDFTELGNHSEFLGLKTRQEMLAEYFVHDGGSTQDWRVKGHAVVPFWKWVATWGAVVNMPSDLGHEDGGFLLPPLTMTEHVVEAAHDHRETGMLFATEARTLGEQRAVRRASIDQRVVKVAELCRAPEQAVVWCELNAEQDAIAEALGGACVSIDGSTADDDKIALCHRWLRGDAKVLVSKVAIFGAGMNFQNCHRVIFAGASHSFEGVFQAVRRCWRYGQTQPVTVDVVRADVDQAIVENYRRKEIDFASMAREMTAHVGANVRAEVAGLSKEWNDYTAAPITVPAWLRSEA